MLCRFVLCSRSHGSFRVGVWYPDPRPTGLGKLLRMREPVESDAAPGFALLSGLGAVAQLGERLICIQEVAGSIPTSSTRV